MTNIPRFTDQEIFRLAKQGFQHELGLLTEITGSGRFRSLLPHFLTYKAFLANGRQDYLGEGVVEELLSDRRLIDATESSAAVRNLFLCANLAASCEIFSGWTIPVNDLEAARTHEYLEIALANAATDREHLGRQMAQRLNNGDTVRVVQTLKLLGLLKADCSLCHQVSLGASIGRRDYHAFHLEPSILPMGVIGTSTTVPPLRFSVKPGNPADIILMDNDPLMQPVYDQLNKNMNGHLNAIVTDLYDGLDWIARQVKNSALLPRDMVVAFRIEPQAFTDIAHFLEGIGRVIAESADLVMTIGSGDTTDGFRHRLEVLEEINQHLSENGMNPVRVKCYQGDTADEQRAKPVLGLNQYASYETLYCRIDKNKLNVG